MFGTLAGGAPVGTVAAVAMRWTPVATPYDRAGNVSTIVRVTGPTPLDQDF